MTNSNWDKDEFSVIDSLIIATVKIQNDNTSNIKFSTVVNAPKKKYYLVVLN